MAEEVDTRMSPSLHPDSLSLIEDYDDDTRHLLGGAQTVLSEAQKALQSIHDKKKATAQNLALTDAAKLVDVDNFAIKRMATVEKSWGNAIEALNNNVQKLEQELNAPIEQTGSYHMATEIRSVIRSLPEGERMTAIQRAINAGDERTVSATLGGPALLSGISEELQSSFLQEWHEKQRPLEAKRVRAMKATANLLNDHYKILKKEVTKAVGVYEEYGDSRNGKRTLLRTWTAAEIRERVKAANEPFGVPV